MKRARRCYLIAPVFVLALLAAGCVLDPATADRAAARHLASVYQAPALLAQAAPAVAGSLNRNLPQSVALDRRKRVDRVVNQAFAPAPLLADTIRRLSQGARDQGRRHDLARAADWLDKPLARRMIALQREVSKPRFARDLEQFASQPADNERKQRLRLVDQLGRDMHLADLQTDFNVTLLGAMIRARNLAVDPGARVDETQIQRILTRTRNGLHRKLGQQLPLMLLYVYRDVETDTLERYANLQHQSAMIWANEMLARSIGRALDAAGRSIPDALNTKE